MVVTTGTLSAFLVNDAVCLVMAPLVIEVRRSLRRKPIPYLLAVAMAPNVGSTATNTGIPQNILIGVLSRWRADLRGGSHLTAKPVTTRPHKAQMGKLCW